jgi:hypothetical protein
MTTYHVFGAEEAYTIIEFADGDDCRGELESWADARDSVVRTLARDLAAFPSAFTRNVSYVRFRKLLHHIRQCAAFSDFSGGIRYRDFENPSQNFPLA